MNGLVLVFALAAGALALWLDMRLEERAPRTITWAFVHTAAAIMALQLMPQLMVLIIVLLPALVYAWLATIWLLKLVQRAAHLR